MDHKNLMINSARLQQHIEELGQFGKLPNGGVTRFPYTDVEEQAKNYLIQIMKQASLDVRLDAVGNIIGRKQGRSKQTILCGSHFDTVRNGGHYDGCLGVLSAIEVLHTMHEQGLELHHSVEVIAFKNEEGNRFTTIMTGSRAICGRLEDTDLDAIDADGITLREAANQFHYPIESYLTCHYDFQNIIAFLELHIEQGSVLEKHHLPVGIVKGIAGLRRFHIAIHGISGHSGAIPMEDRIDPVQAFGEIATFIFQNIKKYSDAVATIGEIHTYPGSCNVICDHVTCSLDIRSLSILDMDVFMNEVDAFIQEWVDRGFQIEMKEIQNLAPALCDPMLMEFISDAIDDEHESKFTLMSGAGHDAMNFHGLCPMGMIFVRSALGYSHRPEEFTTIEDCTVASNVLFRTFVRLSKEKTCI